MANANSEVNKVNLINDGKNKDDEDILLSFSNDATFIQLNTTDIRGLYTGQAEVSYSNQGEYDAQLLYNSIPEGTIFKGIIKIGSSIDVMNKRTNDLIFILTVITVLYIFYSELKPPIKTT